MTTFNTFQKTAFILSQEEQELLNEIQSRRSHEFEHMCAIETKNNRRYSRIVKLVEWCAEHQRLPTTNGDELGIFLFCIYTCMEKASEYFDGTPCIPDYQIKLLETIAVWRWDLWIGYNEYRTRQLTDILEWMVLYQRKPWIHSSDILERAYAKLLAESRVSHAFKPGYLSADNIRFLAYIRNGQ